MFQPPHGGWEQWPPIERTAGDGSTKAISVGEGSTPSSIFEAVAGAAPAAELVEARERLLERAAKYDVARMALFAEQRAAKIKAKQEAQSTADRV